MMVASFARFSSRSCCVSLHFSLVLFGSTGSCVTESGKHALRMLSPMISQIDIAVVKLSHDVVFGGVSAACTYVDLILDIFVFFSNSAFVSRRSIFNETYWISSFSLSFRHSLSHTPQLFVAAQLFAICMFAKQFRHHCQPNIARRSFSM